MMKKLFSLSIAALATIGLASCTQEAAPEVSESGNSSFSIFASTPDTKTAVNEDMNGVIWSAKDSLNIFHAAAGSTTYENDGGFAFSSDNTFNGEVKGELSSSNDWYAFYPYISKMVTPGAKTAGYATIGCASNGVQKQNGNDDMSHLAGKNLPLYGKLSGVAKDQTPSFSMNQVASVVAVKVKNTTSSPLTVTNVQFTAPNAVVGTFYVDFAGESLVCTSSGAKYVDSTATLNVIGASALAQGAEATYYLAIRPFDAAAGQNLQISVNGYKKTIDLTKAVSFVPGKIKTIGFNYDYTNTLPEPINKSGLYRVEDISWLSVGDWIVIAAFDASSAIGPAQTNNRQGVEIVKNVDGQYATLTGYDGMQYFEIVDGTQQSSYGLKSVYGDQHATFLAATSSSNNYLKSVSTLTDNASWSITIDADGSANMVAQGSSTHNTIRYNDSNDLFAAYLPNSASADVSIYKLYGLKPCAAPRSDILPSEVLPGTTVSLSCLVEGVTIYYTLDGSTPSSSSSVYTDPIVLNSSCTIKAIATKAGYADSEVASYEYKVKAVSAGQYSFTIVPSDFNGTSYAANNGTHEITAVCTSDNTKTMAVSVVTNQIMLASSAMQWQKANAFLYNKTDLGTINSVTVNSTDGTFTTYYGTTEHPTSGTTIGNGYFTVKTGSSATGKTSSVVVVFTIS